MMENVTITSEGKYRIYTNWGIFETDNKYSINGIINALNEEGIIILNSDEYNYRYTSTKEKLAEEADNNLCQGYIKNDDCLDGKSLRRIRRKNNRRKR